MLRLLKPGQTDLVYCSLLGHSPGWTKQAPLWMPRPYIRHNRCFIGGQGNTENPTLLKANGSLRTSWLYSLVPSSIYFKLYNTISFIMSPCPPLHSSPLDKLRAKIEVRGMGSSGGGVAARSCRSLLAIVWNGLLAWTPWPGYKTVACQSNVVTILSIHSAHLPTRWWKQYDDGIY